MHGATIAISTLQQNFPMRTIAPTGCLFQVSMRWTLIAWMPRFTSTREATTQLNAILYFCPSRMAWRSENAHHHPIREELERRRSSDHAQAHVY
jgi:hypothetical protein